LQALGDKERTVWLADSFEGLPAEAGSRLHETDTLAVAEDDVRDAFQAHGLLDDRVHLLKGWFKDSLPKLSQHHFAVVRLDGDLYGSTMDGLTNLYPALSPGGYLIVDDYGNLEPCRKAVEDYRRAQQIEEPVTWIDECGVYWRK